MTEYVAIKSQKLTEKVSHSNLTKSEIVKRAGMSRDTLRKWESGNAVRVRKDYVRKLAEVLSTTEDAISRRYIDPKSRNCVKVSPGKIREACLSLGLSYSDVAKKIGATYKNVNYWDTGKGWLDTTQCRKMCDCLGVLSDWLTGKDNTKLAPLSDYSRHKPHFASGQQYADTLDRVAGGQPITCIGCRYRGKSGTMSVCNYLDMTGVPRGCRVKDCTRYDDGRYDEDGGQAMTEFEVKKEWLKQYKQERRAYITLSRMLEKERDNSVCSSQNMSGMPSAHTSHDLPF